MLSEDGWMSVYAVQCWNHQSYIIRYYIPNQQYLYVSELFQGADTKRHAFTLEEEVLS